MTDLHKEGGFAGYIGRPFDSILIPPAYGITFFNKTLESPLTKLGFNSDSSLILYNESLGEASAKYTRIFHFNLTEAGTGKIIDGPFYVPYIDSTDFAGNVSTINLKPLVEVINPQFLMVNPSEIIMYFFSNFDFDSPTGKEVLSFYGSELNFLVRTVEFASNNAEDIRSGSPTANTVPTRNNRNLYDDGFLDVKEPKIAFLSCLLRVGNVKLDSIAGNPEKLFVFAERPMFITFVGERFALDFVPPVLINTIQDLKWAANKDASDSLNVDAVKNGLQKNYYDLISGINSIMYPGYAGINFKTQPITDVYDISLDHVFFINGEYQKFIDFNSANFTGIRVEQSNLKSITFGNPYECSQGLGSSSSNQTITSSGLDPFQRHFAIFHIGTEENPIGSCGAITITGDGFPTKTSGQIAIDDASDEAEIAMAAAVFANSESGWDLGSTLISGLDPDLSWNCTGFDETILVIGNSTNTLTASNALLFHTSGTCTRLSHNICNPQGFGTISRLDPGPFWVCGVGTWGTFSFTSCDDDSVSGFKFSYVVEVPDTVNPTGKDKPEYWKKYWDECGSGPTAPVGGNITVSQISDTVWEGSECIDNIRLYATLFYKPYGYYIGERLKWTLIIGVMSADGGKLDVVWRGNKTSGVEPEGAYARLYALGDGTSQQISVME